MDGSTPKLVAALDHTAVLVKTGHTRLDWASIFNPSNAAAYVQLFDAAAAGDVTVGTTPPVMVLGVATGGFAGPGPMTARFNLGLVAAATTTTGGNTSPSSAVVANFGVR